MRQEHSTPDLQSYADSLAVGKNVTVTADFINAINKTLGIIARQDKEIKRLQKNHNLSRLASQRKYGQMKCRAKAFEARTKIAETALSVADAYLNGLFTVNKGQLPDCAATTEYSKRDWYGLFISLAERIVEETNT